MLLCSLGKWVRPLEVQGGWPAIISSACRLLNQSRLDHWNWENFLFWAVQREGHFEGSVQMWRVATNLGTRMHIIGTYCILCNTIASSNISYLRYSIVLSCPIWTSHVNAVFSRKTRRSLSRPAFLSLMPPLLCSVWWFNISCHFSSSSTTLD